MTEQADSWLPYAGAGGAAVCCLGLELLGGAALASGLGAAAGLSSGLTYAVIVALGGVLTALLVAGYQQLARVNHG
ncbi:MAG: hypothetical protein ABEH81_09895 [Halopenitus sp.]